MKAVIQRVKSAGVRVEGKEVSSIGKGLVLLVCVEKEDDEKVVEWFAKKVVSLRIFADSEGKFNLSLRDVGGEVLLVSNFTVCGFLKKGTRPSFHLAADPEKAEASLQLLKEKIEALGVKVKTGVFRAYMDVELVNDGPVTLFMSYPR